MNGRTKIAIRGLRRAMGAEISFNKYGPITVHTVPARQCRTDPPKLALQPMSDLDLMIANGWGDTPQCDMPADWRQRKNDPGKKGKRK